MPLRPNILVIGGSYFVGRVFIEKLLALNKYNIYALNRGTLPMRLEGVTHLCCDRNDEDLLRKVVPDVPWQAVIDFCAYTPKDIEKTFKALSSHTLTQYIYISTASVYAPSSQQPIDELGATLIASQPQLGSAADYGFHKRLAELAVIEQCGMRNIAYTIVRPTFIFGKYNYAPRESYFFEEILKHNVVVIPDHEPPARFSFVSVWDVAFITAACIDNPTAYGEIFNASGDEVLSYSSLVECFKQVTGVNFTVKVLPISEIEAQRIPLPFPLDEDLLYSGQRSKQLLNYSYFPFQKAMQETYRLYRVGAGLG
ncbi:hypothetical protein A7E78_13625 [Syntrophotalea acetylenivorans]|uniref:NAD-dependent epimerase/dehydratase domain-containing protein n=1 Tax=Syntrophotalea acetylenivorans TaxID=1842532 RepID=A0A1L3GSA0_9BACT|nr:NAD-dependent epimerase/dehydratase family protein [Syntrophotalea acetylenivorans]APG28775.1 hypothetical protein A7E78_13625 [Syntrophotalea acetylenivorans]